MLPSPADLVTATPAGECALALALPLGRDAFLADLAAGPAMDYVRGMVAGRLPDTVWDEDGAPLAHLSTDLLDTAASFGVTTAAQAVLADLPVMFARHQVVTVVAHWRGASLTRGDLLVGAETFLRRVQHGDDQLCHALATRLPAARTDPILALREPSRRQSAFAEMLNDVIIESEHVLPGCLSTEAGITTVIDDLTLRSLHRDRLDRAFPDCLRPGNRIELRDGLHPPEAVAAAIPNGWSGIFDLAICHSSYAAHIIKAGEPDRRVVTNARKIVPGVRLRIQKHLYHSLADGKRNYATELINLFRALRSLRP